ncbi:MAG: transposase [Candidatus Pacebacteria bacterium]|nr:transposase [Candidatus Paceibacterota bacterium]
MSALRLIDEVVHSLINWTKPIAKIGMDGKGVGNRKQVFNITNLVDRQVIGVLPNLNQAQLRKQLLTVDLKLRQAVKEVCIDMDSFFPTIIKECFPNAKIVIDHFHVIKWAIYLLKEEKKVFQDINREKYKIDQYLMIPAHKLTHIEYNRLKKVFDKVPELKNDWKIIHQLRKVYWQDNRVSAETQLLYVIKLCKESKSKYMKDLSKTLVRWFEEILNYYLSKTTNAYTEGIHNHFERIERNHFGIKNIERFCKRLLFCLMPMVVFTELLAQRC